MRSIGELLCLAAFANERMQFHAAGKRIPDGHTCLVQGDECLRVIKHNGGIRARGTVLCSQLKHSEGQAEKKKEKISLKDEKRLNTDTEIMNKEIAPKIMLYSVHFEVFEATGIKLWVPTGTFCLKETKPHLLLEQDIKQYYPCAVYI